MAKEDPNRGRSAAKEPKSGFNWSIVAKTSKLGGEKQCRAGVGLAWLLAYRPGIGREAPCGKAPAYHTSTLQPSEVKSSSNTSSIVRCHGHGTPSLGGRTPKDMPIEKTKDRPRGHLGELQLIDRGQAKGPACRANRRAGSQRFAEGQSCGLTPANHTGIRAFGRVKRPSSTSRRRSSLPGHTPKHRLCHHCVGPPQLTRHTEQSSRIAITMTRRNPHTIPCACHAKRCLARPHSHACDAKRTLRARFPRRLRESTFATPPVATFPHICHVKRTRVQMHVSPHLPRGSILQCLSERGHASVFLSQAP